MQSVLSFNAVMGGEDIGNFCLIDQLIFNKLPLVILWYSYRVAELLFGNVIILTLTSHTQV